MILVDTSVLIDHLRSSNPRLVDLLNSGRVLVHPFVVGEIALGNIKNRDAILSGLAGMPQALNVTSQEVLVFIETAKLAGIGVGYVDAHLLASAKLSGANLWTRDRRVAAAAKRLGLS
jgi:predicted nucleic acid-binding protein